MDSLRRASAHVARGPRPLVGCLDGDRLDRPLFRSFARGRGQERSAQDCPDTSSPSAGNLPSPVRVPGARQPSRPFRDRWADICAMAHRRHHQPATTIPGARCARGRGRAAVALLGCDCGKMDASSWFQSASVGDAVPVSVRFALLNRMGSKFDPLQYGDDSDSDAEDEDAQQELEPSVTTSAKPKVRNRASSSSRLTMGIRDKHSGGVASVACSEMDGQSRSSQEGRLRSS